jgi:murein DD-endopeptidase MepM/ murein hydrolase activator NlpD
MSTKKSFLEKINERLRVKYRFVVLNDETFQEQTSIRLSRYNVIILSASIFFLTLVLSYALVIYTPLKYLIPGYYGNEVTRTRIIQLESRTDSLQMLVQQRNLWLQNVRRVLTGETDSVYTEYMTKYASFNIDSASFTEANAELRSESGNLPPGGERVTTLIENNSSRVRKRMSEMHMISPVDGYLTAKFDRRKEHYGVDLGAKENAPIKSILPGTIITANWTIKTGHVIAVQHDNDMITFYKHNSKLLKRTGDQVKAGEVIAIMGNSGELTTGPHLHFELWISGEPVDPEKYIKF